METCTKYQTKSGSSSFARKLATIATKQPARARYLWAEREKRCGHSLWNPGYMIVASATPRTDAYGNHFAQDELA